MIADAAPATAWRWNDFLLLPVQRRLLRHGVPVELEDRTLDLIVLLVQHRDHALDRHEITTAIWGKRPVADTTLRQLVYKARRAVGDDGAHQTTIHTLYGRSLQWIAPVEMVLEPGSRFEPAKWDGSGDAPIEPASKGAVVQAVMSVPVAVAERASSGAATPALALPPPAAGRLVRGSGAARRRGPNTRRLYVVAGGCIMILVVFAIVLTGGVGWRSRRRTAVPRRNPAREQPMATTSGPVTIAVLPFLGMDPKSNGSYLGDGITEELINRLGRFPKLRVAARTSSFMFRGKPVDVRAAARALGVAYVLEGGVQRSEDRIRVRVALVSAKGGYELWSDEYDPAAGDVLKVEDEIATAVIKELHPELNPHELAVLAAMPGRARVDPAAHDFYLVGLQYLNRRTPADLEQAVAYFRKAVTESPTYAEAWAALAMAYGVTGDYKEIPPDTYYAAARAAVARALALDPNLARAHAVLGWLYEIHWQWPEARAEFKRALQLDPSDPTARQWYAMYLWYMRDMGGALEQMRLAHQLDPLSPVINVSLGRALLYAGHVNEAIAQYRSTIVAQPNFALAHLLLGETFLALDRNAEALKEVRDAIRLSPRPPPSTYVAALGVALKMNGDIAGARAQYAALQERSQRQFVSGVSLAWLCAELGDKDGAVTYLERAVDQHDPMMQPAVTDSAAWWYNDPRMARLRVRMGLPSR